MILGSFIEELVFVFVFEGWVYFYVFFILKIFYWIYLEDKRKELKIMLRFNVRVSWEWDVISEKRCYRSWFEREDEEFGFEYLRCDV